MLGIAFPVGIRRMTFPILGHLFESLIGNRFAKSFINPVIGPGARLALIDENMGELMGKLVGNLVPHPAITNAEHDLRFTLGSELVQLYRKAVRYFARVWQAEVLIGSIQPVRRRVST